jgi:hypothetical protein
MPPDQLRRSLKRSLRWEPKTPADERLRAHYMDGAWREIKRRAANSPLTREI